MDHLGFDVVGALVGLCALASIRLRALGVGGAGQDVVDGDAVLRHFAGKGLGPVGHGCAHGVGDTQTLEGLLDRGGDHVDDPSVAGVFHAGQHGLGQDVITDQVVGKKAG